MDLQEIKTMALKSQALLDDKEILWLIKQAEIVEAIKQEIKGRWSTETVSVNRLHQIFDK